MLQIGAVSNECVFLAVTQNKGWCHIKINDIVLLFLSFANEFAFYVYLILGCLQGFSSSAANVTYLDFVQMFFYDYYLFICSLLLSRSPFMD